MLARKCRAQVHALDVERRPPLVGSDLEPISVRARRILQSVGPNKIGALRRRPENLTFNAGQVVQSRHVLRIELDDEAEVLADGLQVGTSPLDQSEPHQGIDVVRLDVGHNEKQALGLPSVALPQLDVRETCACVLIVVATDQG